MPKTQRAPSRPNGPLDRMQQSAATLDAWRQEAEAAGRDAWNKATREGRKVVARTEQEIRDLGFRILAGQATQGTRPQAQRNSSQPSARTAALRPLPQRTTAHDQPDHSSGAEKFKRFGAQLGAGVRGATDAATAGLGDPYVALKYSLAGVGVGDNPIERYRYIRDAQRAQDQYDRENYRNARLIGGAVGTVGSIALTGGVGAVGQGAVRIAPYAARSATGAGRVVMAHVGPHLAVGGAGATSSVAGQAAADVLSGRASSVGDYGDAWIGGVAGGIATSYGGPRAGAIAESAATEASRFARTREWSPERLEQNAVLGAHAGRIGDRIGTQWASQLPRRQKGDLGEYMSDVKTAASGQEVVDRQQRLDLSRGYTVFDSLTDAGTYVESKFGPKARLSGNQTRARNEMPLYDVDAWLPSDVGRATGGLPALLFSQSSNAEGR